MAVVVRLMIAAANLNFKFNMKAPLTGTVVAAVTFGGATSSGCCQARRGVSAGYQDVEVDSLNTVTTLNLECGPGRNSVVTVTTHTRNGACQSTAVGWMEKLVPVGTDDPQIIGMHGLIVVVVATAVLFSVQVTAECANACFGHGECSVSACTQRWGQGAGCRVQRLLVRQASLADQLDATQPT